MPPTRRIHQTFPRSRQLPLRIQHLQGYGYKFAFEAKPNERRGHNYFAVTGSYLAFILTLDHPEIYGVNGRIRFLKNIMGMWPVQASKPERCFTLT